MKSLYFQKAPLNLIGMTYLGSVIILTPTDVLDLLKIILSQLLFYSDKKKKKFFCPLLHGLTPSQTDSDIRALSTEET